MPTVKILAIGEVTGAPLSAELRGKEVRATVNLYLTGKVDQWYLRGDGKGTVFLMNVATGGEAKALLGVGDRALAVLSALLSFHPQQDLVAGERLVVFPSNAQLSLRAHGMAPATLRRHLAALVESALVVRRDSPNGKRYARKGDDGEIETAFGFDLGPLLARAEEFERMAERIRVEQRAMRVLREPLTRIWAGGQERRPATRASMES